jgi:hypothetical protein
VEQSHGQPGKTAKIEMLMLARLRSRRLNSSMTGLSAESPKASIDFLLVYADALYCDMPLLTNFITVWNSFLVAEVQE